MPPTKSVPSQSSSLLIVLFQIPFRPLKEITTNQICLIALVVLLFDALLGSITILKVPYTEIDWKAYMQQVETFWVYGERDYRQIRGDTGPLVYPASFLYIYTLLYQVTEKGAHVYIAQWIFLVIHILLITTTILVYYTSEKYHSSSTPASEFSSFPTFDTPLYTILLLVLSRRIMSIFVLRLFNDGIEAVLVYVAIIFMAKNNYPLAALCYSMAISVKMNALLYAPVFLMLMVRFYTPPITGIISVTAILLGICVAFQVLVGSPFLLAKNGRFIGSYLVKSFELSRVFTHKWSVNFAFLPNEYFISKTTALFLLFGHLFCLFLFAHFRWLADQGGVFKFIYSVVSTKSRTSPFYHALPSDYIVTALFTSNLIGITFSRTLHYQFYTWYYHTLPYLVSKTKLHWIVQISLLVMIELVYNIYPPRPWASLLLHLCHFTILAALWFSKAGMLNQTSQALSEGKKLI